MLEKKNKFSIKTKFPFILASASNIRKSILKKTGLEFKIMSSNINEGYIKKKFKDRPYTFISKKLSQQKPLQ